MWDQCSSKYVAAVGTQLLAKIHLLSSKVEDTTCIQNHPVDCLSDCIDFIGEVSNRVGSVVDELNSCIDAHDVQIKQLANMVNNLVGKTEGQAKEIKALKTNQEEHC